MHRIGLILHPTRPVQGAVDTLNRWAAAQRVEVVDLSRRSGPEAIDRAGLEAGDLIAAVGGDGTVLRALRVGAQSGTPVLGVACGSLGALGAVSAADLEAALDRVLAGDWFARRLPALRASTGEGDPVSAINDLVLIRRGSSQLIVRVWVGDDLYTRLAGDGVVVATCLGSSAYSMAAGGSLLLAGIDAYICTPLAMHGGCAPPVVVAAGSTLTLEVDPGHGGFDFEVDGQSVESEARRYEITMQQDHASLVELERPDSGVPGLRRRGLIADSPRVLARDARSECDEAEAPTE